MERKTLFLIYTLLIMGVVMFLFGSCKKDESNIIPTVTTASITEITQTTATAGGEIVDDGGAAITVWGVCWNIYPNPTIEDHKTEDGTGAGSFTCNVTDLDPNTTYYLRAYATNSQGTAYGNTLIFETLFNTFTDPRDSKIYKTVTIGNQVWMAENLAYLPSVVEPYKDSNTTIYYYVYGYDGTDVAAAKATANYTTYGVLYNWTAAMAGCPAGWHLPSEAEWTELENYLADNGYNYDGTTGGGGDKIAKSLGSTTGWVSNATYGAVGNTDHSRYRNKSGFTALPGGWRTSFGSFTSIGVYGYWWSATEYDDTNARNFYMNNANTDLDRTYGWKEIGFSVRCVKD